MHNEISKADSPLPLPGGKQKTEEFGKNGDTEPSAGDSRASYHQGCCCWGYRCPSPDEDAPHGTEAQIGELFEILCDRVPGVTWAGSIVDPAELCQTPLLSRPGGQRLGELPSGSHVITSVYHLGVDRLKDLLSILKLLDSRGLIVHFTENLNYTSSARDWLHRDPVAVARHWLSSVRDWIEWENTWKSERAKRRAARMRPFGRAGGRRPKRGYKRRGPKNHRRIVVDREYLKVALFIGYRREVLGMSWWRIADAVEERIAQDEKRKPYTRGSGKRKWSMSRTRDAYLVLREFYPTLDLSTLYPKTGSDSQGPEKAERDKGNNGERRANSTEPQK